MKNERFGALFAELRTNSSPPELEDYSLPLQPDNIPFLPESIPEDQSSTRGSPTHPVVQDQADQPFKEAVPLEDELADLLDDLD
jgi:hypothetical protein